MTSRPVLRAVCGVLASDAAGRVLMVRRSDDGTWGLPGGGVKSGETWQAAALRECLEETGWQVQVEGLLGIYSDPATQVHRYPDGDLRHFVGVVFTARALERTGAGDGEAQEVAFFPVDDLPSPLFAPDAPALRDAADGATTPRLR